MGEKVAGKIAREAQPIGAIEHEYAIELLVTAQGNQRETPGTLGLGEQQLGIDLARRPEPRTLEVLESRRDRRQDVCELHALVLFQHAAVARQQMSNLVLRIVQQEAHRVELV